MTITNNNSKLSIGILCSFTTALYNVCKETIQNKTVTVRPSSKSFYNSYLRKLKRKVNRIHKRAKSAKTPECWSNFRHERNHCVNEIHRCKMEHDNNRFSKLDSADIDSKTYFKLVKECLTQTNDSNIPPINDGGTILIEDHDKATAFNQFFSKASKLDDSNAILPAINEPMAGVSILKEITISEQEVKDQLSILDVNKSYGHDLISPMFLKRSGNALIQPLTKLFNLSLSST